MMHSVYYSRRMAECEAREPFITEAASAIFDCTDETEPEGDDE